MSSTALKTDEEKKEYFDTSEELDKKVDYLAELVKSSKHFVVFTGAGISTSAGIPDFRSGMNTVLPTGPGAWEKAAKGDPDPKKRTYVSMASAIPTPSHMALLKLHEVGLLKFLISQNTDGLHRKSGFPKKSMAELHGNTNLEICRNKNCKKQYLRDFRTRNAQQVHDHETGRNCESCGGMLYDSIINFGENLPEEELKNGFLHSKKADLCLALGSSLRVKPAADMPLETAQKGGKLVIVNLQATPLDKYSFRINGMIDDVIIRLMKKLNLEIPEFTLKRRIIVSKTNQDQKDAHKTSKPILFLRGVDETGAPYQLFRKVVVNFSEGRECFTKNEEPIFITPQKTDLKSGKVKVDLEFQGHYNEPNFTFELELENLKLNEPKFYFFEFVPSLKKWTNFKSITL